MFALIVFKLWRSLFHVINKQQSAEKSKIAVNMVRVFLDETHLVDVSQKCDEGI
jgi:hypothetical protein